MEQSTTAMEGVLTYDGNKDCSVALATKKKPLTKYNESAIEHYGEYALSNEISSDEEDEEDEDEENDDF